MADGVAESWKIFIMRLTILCVYFFGGAAIFLLIEKGDPNYASFNNTTATMEEIRRNITYKYNISPNLFEELVREIVKTTNDKPNAPWNYFDSLTYVLHLLTTIGYGNITPKTIEGQLVTIFYALFGIPLTLLTLKAMGSHFNEVLTKIITAIETKCLKRNQVKHLELKVILCNLFLTLIYLFLSALTSVSVDHYTYAQSLYVWFITMTTVGFGDFIPKQARGSSFYNILIGLCFMSGTIDAIMSYQEKKGSEDALKPSGSKFFSCCTRKSSSLHVHSAPERNTNQACIEMEVEDSPNNKQTQTTGIFNYFAQY